VPVNAGQLIPTLFPLASKTSACPDPAYPVAFSLMAYRFFLQVLRHLRGA